MWLPSQCSKPHQGVIKKVWFIILNYKFLKNSFTTIIKVNISGIIAIMSKIKICINIIVPIYYLLSPESIYPPLSPHLCTF